jgi:hypothetical protein
MANGKWQMANGKMANGKWQSDCSLLWQIYDSKLFFDSEAG